MLNLLLLRQCGVYSWFPRCRRCGCRRTLQLTQAHLQIPKLKHQPIPQQELKHQQTPHPTNTTTQTQTPTNTATVTPTKTDFPETVAIFKQCSCVGTDTILIKGLETWLPPAARQNYYIYHEGSCYTFFNWTQSTTWDYNLPGSWFDFPMIEQSNPCGTSLCCPSPTPTQTNTQTPSQTKTQTPTNTITQTPTKTPTSTPTQTKTPTRTQKVPPTPFPTNTPTKSITPTETPKPPIIVTGKQIGRAHV